MSESLEAIKLGPVESGVDELILKRWSPRTFADKPVSGADLTKIVTAAAWAPSSSNEQPWRFLVGKKGDATYAKIFESLVEFNQMWAKSAPVLILTVAKKTFSKSGQENGWAMHDTGAASVLMTLEATVLGLHMHGMAGLDRAKVAASFALPEDFEVAAVWALGYLGELEALPEKLQVMEKAPRSRNPIEDYVFSAWGEVAVL